MKTAKLLYEENLTPGAYAFKLLSEGQKVLPDFYRDDLQQEFDRIWDFQKQFYPAVLTSEHHDKIVGLTRKDTDLYFRTNLDTEQSELKGNATEKKLKRYELRKKAMSEQLDLAEIATVLVEINKEISNSSGYLGEISDRSKKLYFNNQTVGQFLFNQVKANPHARLKKQVFYRQDYLDEFERIWEVQAKANSDLTEELKREIRDVVIFYQRRLKSQKHLIADCEFEKYHKAVPKSSPLFQEFRILQNLNNTEVFVKGEEKQRLGEEDHQYLRKLLRYADNMSETDLLKLMGTSKKAGSKVNFKKLEGNRTFATLTGKFLKILEYEGYDLSGVKDPEERHSEIKNHFIHLGFNTDILDFEIDFEDQGFDKNPTYQFWHLLYSAEDLDKLKEKLKTKYNFNDSAAAILASTSFEADYGRLSSKAIRKILPHMIQGHDYFGACDLEGYNHSSSVTAEENEKRELKDQLDLLPMNSLRNPIVEKILNQVVNQVNAIIEHPDMGRPDEIRIEMARELKSSADERQSMTEGIAKATAENDRIRKKLKTEFDLPRVTRNDIIRYKLWEEAGHVSVYSGKPIQRSEIFSRNYDIDHVIPQSKLFDDSYSNKVLCERSWNEDKSNETAIEYLEHKLSPEEFESFRVRVEKDLTSKGGMSKTKCRKLLMFSKDIPDDFIERQLRESQYIAKKAHELLLQVTRNVQPTVGSITNRLRSDWEVVDVLKELNWPKYETLGMTHIIDGKNGERIKRINDWNKRNDHRHHAMDAITVAFTKPAFVQYLNNLNARSNKGGSIFGIEQKHLYRDVNQKLRFNPPMPDMRKEVKKSLEEILISFKPSWKVATLNKNKVKLKGGKVHTQEVLTPRGQLHKETVYGKIKRYEAKAVAVNSKMTPELAQSVANKKEREAILNRLKENDDNPKKAFAGKNSLNKTPIYLNGGATELPKKVKVVEMGDQFTIRKTVDPDLKVDKVIDEGAKRALQKRLDEFGGKPKEAFSNLDENPIWLNKEENIQIKSVKITGVKNAQALHPKRDHFGELILDENGKEIPNDYVSLGNNHHVAIFEDEDGNLSEEVVSFFEASQRIADDQPVINSHNEEGHPLKFTLKQNEYFVFPSDDFNPSEVDLKDPKNLSLISPNLFRVQKIAKKNYMFRHHLETTVETPKELNGVNYKLIASEARLMDIKKVQINRLGEIVKVGE
jgi:CRISPR-associated endonuclease Csn1